MVKQSNIPDKPRRVFGRKAGRRLNKDRQKSLDDLYPLYELSLPESKALTLQDLFKDPDKKTIFEVGFGNGEHLLALDRNMPDVNFIGAEPFRNGMANFLNDLSQEHKDHPLCNLKLFMGDALFVFEALEGNSLDTIYILNPDPWPKTRHHKRRIINQDNLKQFARTLKPKGRLVMATDVDDLAEWMVIQCSNFEGLEWTAERKEDWLTPPPEWTETKYAFKGRTAGRRQTFLEFIAS